MQVKYLGKLYDTSGYITLPLEAKIAGKHKIIIKRPNGTNKQRICDVQIGEKFFVPNYNGKKTLQYGSNIIDYIYQPDNQRFLDNGIGKFEVFFEAPEVIDSGDDDNNTGFSNEIVEIQQASPIWEVDNPKKRPFMVIPDNPLGVDIDFINQSTPDKVIINWKFIPRKGFIQFY